MILKRIFINNLIMHFMAQLWKILEIEIEIE